MCAASKKPEASCAPKGRSGRARHVLCVMRAVHTMKFLVLAYGDEKDWKALSKEKQAELLAQDERLRKRGDLVAAVGPATTVRAWAGRPEITPGPFARGERPLAGFGVIEASDLDEAIALVAKTPCAVAKGAVDVWPLRNLD
jgi:hypothetical protein